MGKRCLEDIHTLHAPLIHKTREIETQLEYNNQGNSAQITDLTEKNAQGLLEEYFSKVGIPVNENPSGLKNNDNLQYLTQFEFIPGSLEVYLSGMKLNGEQSDPNRDFDVITTGSNAYKGFIIRLEPNKSHRLNKPPQQDEALSVSYSKRITFNTKGGT